MDLRVNGFDWDEGNRKKCQKHGLTIAQIEAEFFATARASSIIQRMVDAKEIASLVAYVASPRSSATNGAALRAEGGLVNTIA